MTHGDLGMVDAVCGFNLDDAWLPLFAFGSFFLFSFFFFSFLFSGIGFLALPASSSEEEGGDEELDEVEG